MFEDIFLAVYLSLISGIVLSGASSVTGVLSSGGIALGFIVGVMTLGRWAVPLLNRLLRISSNEVFERIYDTIMKVVRWRPKRKETEEEASHEEASQP